MVFSEHFKREKICFITSHLIWFILFIFIKLSSTYNTRFITLIASICNFQVVAHFLFIAIVLCAICHKEETRRVSSRARTQESPPFVVHLSSCLRRLLAELVRHRRPRRPLRVALMLRGSNYCPTWIASYPWRRNKNAHPLLLLMDYCCSSTELKTRLLNVAGPKFSPRRFFCEHSHHKLININRLFF